MIGLALLSLSAMAFNPDSYEAALTAEMQRAMDNLVLAGQERPHHITVTVATGAYATIRAQDGAVIERVSAPSRDLRVDVRVGDATLDNGNFLPSMGIPDGITSRQLADEHSPISLRRDVWLALDAAYKGATQTYAAKTAARRGRQGPFAADLGPINTPTRLPYTAPRVPDDDRLSAVVQTLAKASAAPAHLESSAVAASDWAGSGLVMSTEGTAAWIPTSSVVVRVEMATRANDGSRLRNTRSWVAQSPNKLPDASVLEAEIAAASSWLERLRSAPVEDDYLGPVFFEAPAAAELFRQLLHTEITGTPPWEHAPDSADDNARPIPVARIGRRLLPTGWTVVDDAGSDPGLASHQTHDYEAVPTRRVTVVSDGILRDVLMSRVPRLDRDTSTGHGRSSGHNRRVAMPTQVYVDPKRGLGIRRLKRVALRHAKSAGLPYVLVVRRLLPPALSDDMEFAFTGDAPLAGLTAPTEAYRLYSDGRTEPVRGLRFSGVDRRALRDIVAASSRNEPVEMKDSADSSSRFSIHALGGHPVSWSVPAVVIGEMELRGSGGGERRIVPAPSMESASSVLNGSVSPF